MPDLEAVLSVYAWQWMALRLYVVGNLLWHVRTLIRLAPQVDWGWWLDDLAHGRLYPR